MMGKKFRNNRNVRIHIDMGVYFLIFLHKNLWPIDKKTFSHINSPFFYDNSS